MGGVEKGGWAEDIWRGLVCDGCDTTTTALRRAWTIAICTYCLICIFRAVLFFFLFFEQFQRASASFNIPIGFLRRWRLLNTSSISLTTKSNQRANPNSRHDTDETTEFTDASPTLRGMMHDPGTFI